MLCRSFMRYGAILLAILLAACIPNTPQEPSPVPTDAMQVRTTPTPQPDTPYIEAIQPITLDTVTQIQPLGRLESPGRASTIFTHDLSPDGTRLAALNNDLLIAWDTLTGDVIFTTSRDTATEVFYSSDKTEIYTIEQDGTVNIYDEGGDLLNTFAGQEDYNGSAAFYEDTDWLALGNEFGDVKIWDTVERLSLVTLDAHTRSVEQILFSPDGDRIATYDREAVVRVWDWQTRQEIASFEHEDAVLRNMVFSPDGSLLATATVSYIGLWSIEDNALLSALQITPGGADEILAFSPDGTYLLSGGRNTDMTLWDVETSNQVGVMPEVRGDRLSAAFSPDSTLLVTSVLDTDVALWNLTEINDETIQRSVLDVGTLRIFEVNWSADGFMMLFVDATGPIYVWGIGAD